MKNEKGIRPLCIAAIIANILFFIFIVREVLTDETDTKKSFIIILVLLGAVIAASYSAQILIIYKRYYARRPITKAYKWILQVSRVIQILFTLTLATFVCIAGYDFVTHIARFYRSSDFYTVCSLILLFLLVIYSNTMTAIKGIYFMRTVKKNYVDAIMDTFD